MSINPNFPVLDYATCWTAGPQQSCIQPYWSSLLERTDAGKGQVSVRRGKQYALDQVQPGEMMVSLANKDGALDPANAASPFAGFVLPYRLFRMRAQWSPTVNLFTQNQATAGEAVAIANAPQVEQPWGTGTIADTNSVAQNATYPTTVVADGSAFQGANVFQTAFPASGAYAVPVLGMQNFSVVPGGPATFTARARSKTASISTTARLQVVWVNAAGSTISTVNGTAASLAAGSSAAWTTLTVSATAPSNAAGAVLNLVPASGPATAWLLQSDGYQYEKALAASTFTVPGTWYPLFTGYVQRWPQRWTPDGNYGVSDLTVIDQFGFLSQRAMLAPFKADLLALNPNFLYALDEAAGTNAFADLTNKRGPAFVSPAVLSLAAAVGQAVSSADNAPRGPDQATALTGAFLGAPGPVVHSVPPTGTPSLGAILIPPNPATGLIGPPQTGGFTRLIAARVTGLATFGTQSAWYYNSGSPGDELDISFSLGGGSAFIAATSRGPAASSGVTYPIDSFLSGSTLIDSDWHLYGVSLSPDGKTLSAWLDGSGVSVTSVTGASARPDSVASNVGVDSIAGLTSPVLILNNSQWIGDVAFAAELPFEMTGATWLGLAQSWRNAWATTGTNVESSDTRYQRILSWLIYTGPARISAGFCKSYGPAVDVAASAASPLAGLQALQNVVDTENGQHFNGADGAVVFQSRGDRYNKTATVSFGELQAGGEIPYLSDIQFDFDPTRVANDVQVTAQYGSALYRQVDATSQSNYGAITLQRTVNSLDTNELTAAAQYLLLQNKQPQQRIRTLTVDPSSNPSLWPKLLALDLGNCAQVTRRPKNVTPIVVTGFIEQIQFLLDGTTNKATFGYQISNNNLLQVWQWNTSRWGPDAGSMTVHTALAASLVATTVVIDTATTGTTASTAAGSYPVTVQIDAEQIVLNNPPSGSSSPQTFTGVTRAANGTAVATHSVGAVLSLATIGRWGY